jgi:hypothetical protein
MRAAASRIEALESRERVLQLCADAVNAMSVPIPEHLDGCLFKGDRRLPCQCGQNERARNAMHEAEDKVRIALAALAGDA